MDLKPQPTDQSSNSGKLVSLMDYQLWKEFREGDLAAYALIYRRYFFVLYAYGKKLSPDHELIKDCVQDLFVKIWNNRENLSDTTSIRYYLLTALKRKLIDTIKSTKLRFLSDQELTDFEIGEATQDESDFFNGQKEKVFKAITKLSRHQQLVLQRKFLDNQSNQEIATELNISIQSVYNLVFKSLRSLRKQLSSIIIISLLSIFQ